MENCRAEAEAESRLHPWQEEGRPPQKHKGLPGTCNCRSSVRSARCFLPREVRDGTTGKAHVQSAPSGWGCAGPDCQALQTGRRSLCGPAQLGRLRLGTDCAPTALTGHAGCTQGRGSSLADTWEPWGLEGGPHPGGRSWPCLPSGEGWLQALNTPWGRTSRSVQLLFQLQRGQGSEQEAQKT